MWVRARGRGQARCTGCHSGANQLPSPRRSSLQLYSVQGTWYRVKGARYADVKTECVAVQSLDVMMLQQVSCGRYTCTSL